MIDTPPPMPDAASIELSVALGRNRMELAHRLVQSAALVERFRLQIPEESADLEVFVARELACLVDYLTEHFGRGKAEFRHLYLGERLKMAQENGDSIDAQNERVRLLLASDREIFTAALSTRVSKQALELLESFFSDAMSSVATSGRRTLKVVFVGDCLFLDVVAFLVAQLAELGISLQPYYITSHAMDDITRDLNGLRGESFDLVFFSPFTYSLHMQFEQLLRASGMRSFLTSRHEIMTGMFRDVERVIDTLDSKFECPVFIHNAGMILRDTPVRAALKNALTYPMRRIARRDIDLWMRKLLETKGRASFPHLHLFDEIEMVRHEGERRLGSFYYNHPIQHPAYMGLAVANRYTDICFVTAHLKGRKLIVCDLDNTLWEGVIGEGVVTHHLDRQNVLRALKEKGVLLAIVSKNDPANVHWRGAGLGEQDFIHSSISWSPKIEAFSRIERDLNLKHKDFVFIDDRADEREMVRVSYPGILPLDPNDPAIWRRFQLWVDMLDSDGSSDRTDTYRQREERESFVGAVETEASIDRTERFSSLNLELTISTAARGDVKRVAELVNRTNQFNTMGSRTSVSEVSRWLGDSKWQILQGSLKDRFGDMGVVCILIAQEHHGILDIPVFVLSCRVFGYGVESAMLNQLKRFALQRNLQLRGRYTSTPHNSPCKDVYSQNGFVDADGLWSWAGEVDIADPLWLSVRKTGLASERSHCS